MFDRIPELTKEKVSLDLDFEEKNKSSIRELERQKRTRKKAKK